MLLSTLAIIIHSNALLLPSMLRALAIKQDETMAGVGLQTSNDGG